MQVVEALISAGYQLHPYRDVTVHLPAGLQRHYQCFDPAVDDPFAGRAGPLAAIGCASTYGTADRGRACSTAACLLSSCYAVRHRAGPTPACGRGTNTLAISG